jgi:hypothetical protein
VPDPRPPLVIQRLLQHGEMVQHELFLALRNSARIPLAVESSGAMHCA